jgi:hypothetical protein
MWSELQQFRFGFRQTSEPSAGCSLNKTEQIALSVAIEFFPFPNRRKLRNRKFDRLFPGPSLRGAQLLYKRTAGESGKFIDPEVKPMDSNKEK